MKMEFNIYGEPMGKGRPRFLKNGRAYTPKSTSAYEDMVVFAYKSKNGTFYFSDASLKVTINAYFNIPKSTSKKNAEKMSAGRMLPKKKPDADNIAKIICDALNGVAYHDDAQIVELNVKKLYSRVPRVEVEIEEVML